MWKRIHFLITVYFWSAISIINMSMVKAISPVINPIMNMTTHLLMLIRSRSWGKFENMQHVNNMESYGVWNLRVVSFPVKHSPPYNDFGYFAAISLFLACT